MLEAGLALEIFGPLPVDAEVGGDGVGQVGATPAEDPDERGVA